MQNEKINLEKQNKVEEIIETQLERNFVNSTIISRHLICTICQEVFYDPKRITCGHTFCHKCISQWIHRNKSCPSCRTTGISLNDLYKDLIASNIIDELEVTCIYKSIRSLKIDCPFKQPLINLPDHVKNCIFDPNKMSSQVKEFLGEEEKKQNLEDDELCNSNNFLNFNPSIGLKARLYQKNKQLMDKILSENQPEKIKGSKTRDTLLDLLK
jgi:hypothetical protein